MCKSSSSFLFPLFFLIVLHCLVTVHFCLVTPFSQGTDHATLTMPPFTLLALQQSLSTPWGSELRGQGWVQALFLRGEISGRGRFGTKEESGKRLFPLLLPRGIICHAIRLRAAQLQSASCTSSAPAGDGVRAQFLQPQRAAWETPNSTKQGSAS